MLKMLLNLPIFIGYLKKEIERINRLNRCNLINNAK